MLAETFPDLAEMTVLDLGGTPASWLQAPVKPGHVTVVNLFAPADAPPPWMAVVVGDACALPDSVTGHRWDLVFSNSVIEHLGGHARCVEFAAAVRSLSSCHWVQTPYRYFPVEPHYLLPGFQFLPAAARRELARRWPMHEGLRDDSDQLLRQILEIQLLSRTELAAYFPDSTIRFERVAGLPKALIAVRGAAERVV